MKNSLRTLTLGALLTAGINAHAGVGLGLGAISNLANGRILSAAIGGGLGAASIAHGANLVNSNRIGWGTFFLILEEQDVITAADAEVLNAADVATKQAFLDIIASDLSQAEKEAELAALFN